MKKEVKEAILIVIEELENNPIDNLKNNDTILQYLSDRYEQGNQPVKGKK